MKNQHLQFCRKQVLLLCCAQHQRQACSGQHLHQKNLQHQARMRKMKFSPVMMKPKTVHQCYQSCQQWQLWKTIHQKRTITQVYYMPKKCTVICVYQRSFLELCKTHNCIIIQIVDTASRCSCSYLVPPKIKMYDICMHHRVVRYKQLRAIKIFI